jgi:hypothetical protein
MLIPCSTSEIQLSWQTLNEMRHLGLTPAPQSYGTIIYTAVKCGRPQLAFDLLPELKYVYFSECLE